MQETVKKLTTPNPKRGISNSEFKKKLLKLT
jgi:hypothetical protein